MNEEERAEMEEKAKKIKISVRGVREIRMSTDVTSPSSRLSSSYGVGLAV